MGKYNEGRKLYMRERRKQPGMREHENELARERRASLSEPERTALLAKEAATRRAWTNRKRSQGIHTETLIARSEYDRLHREQRGVCAICHKPETKLSAKGRVRRLSIDHNHRTGRVRALLCSNCNTLLGLANDDPSILQSATRFATEQQMLDAVWAMEIAVGTATPLMSRRHAVPQLQVEAARKMQEAMGG